MFQVICRRPFSSWCFYTIEKNKLNKDMQACLLCFDSGTSFNQLVFQRYLMSLILLQRLHGSLASAQHLFIVLLYVRNYHVIGPEKRKKKFFRSLLHVNSWIVIWPSFYCASVPCSSVPDMWYLNLLWDGNDTSSGCMLYISFTVVFLI